MRRALRLSEFVVLVAVVALPLKAGGCGSSACITVTPAQLVGGACPSAAAARSRLVVQSCPVTITDVSGPGTLDGNLCCYPVVTQSQNNGFDICGFGAGGSVTSTGFGVGGGGFPGPTSTGFGGSSTVGVGGAGGGIFADAGDCTTCFAALVDGADPSLICSGSTAELDNLAACVCGDAGECTGVCGPSLCAGQPIASPCSGCLQSSTNVTCTDAVSVCMQN